MINLGNNWPKGEDCEKFRPKQPITALQGCIFTKILINIFNMMCVTIIYSNGSNLYNTLGIKFGRPLRVANSSIARSKSHDVWGSILLTRYNAHRLTNVNNNSVVNNILCFNSWRSILFDI